MATIEDVELVHLHSLRDAVLAWKTVLDNRVKLTQIRDVRAAMTPTLARLHDAATQFQIFESGRGRAARTEE